MANASRPLRIPVTSDAPAFRDAPYSWGDLTRMVLAHRRELAIANVVAILGAVAAVPVPLLIPLLVDEVLLHKPGTAIASKNAIFPANWPLRARRPCFKVASLARSSAFNLWPRAS